MDTMPTGMQRRRKLCRLMTQQVGDTVMDGFEWFLSTTKLRYSYGVGM